MNLLQSGFVLASSPHFKCFNNWFVFGDVRGHVCIPVQLVCMPSIHIVLIWHGKLKNIQSHFLVVVYYYVWPVPCHQDISRDGPTTWCLVAGHICVHLVLGSVHAPSNVVDDPIMPPGQSTLVQYDLTSRQYAWTVVCRPLHRQHLSEVVFFHWSRFALVGRVSRVEFRINVRAPLFKLKAK